MFEEIKEKVRANRCSIFSHVERYLISGAVFGAALYTFKYPNLAILGPNVGIITAIVLLGVFLILFVTNVDEAIEVTGFVEDAPKNWQKRLVFLVIGFIYFIPMMQLANVVGLATGY